MDYCKQRSPERQPTPDQKEAIGYKPKSKMKITACWPPYGLTISANPSAGSDLIGSPGAPVTLQLSYRARILRHDRIVGKQRNALDRRLRHQNTIKGVFMNRWQALDGNDVVA